MITNADFVSRVVNGVNALTKDAHISRRYILKIGRDKATTYMAQKLGDRTLFREENLITYISCFDMKEDDVVKCPIIEFRRCSTLMKSKKQLPPLLNSKYGVSILSVTNIDDSEVFDFSTTSSYTNQKNRQFGAFAKKFFIKNNYLYIPDYEVRSVNLELITLDVKAANDASECSNEDCCKSLWDYNFICPDKLLEPIINEVIKEVVSTTISIPVDENSNMDSNQKTQIVQ
jgi:hypothetical protein